MNPNIADHGHDTRFTSTRQPERRTPRGKSPTTYLRRLLAENFTWKNDRTGDVEERPGAEWVALALFVRAINGDVAAIREIFERTDGKPGTEDAVEAEIVAALQAGTLTPQQVVGELGETGERYVLRSGVVKFSIETGTAETGGG